MLRFYSKLKVARSWERSLWFTKSSLNESPLKDLRMKSPDALNIWRRTEPVLSFRRVFLVQQANQLMKPLRQIFDWVPFLSAGPDTKLGIGLLQFRCHLDHGESFAGKMSNH